ncbi:TraX family protein [Vallitalea guaymasensis]|uniref:TraX family protein n=1 Tax=Vallitalea guaymasensis TaxID=1185412 RepID=UPI002355D476|nr:TraX family protein [Vallitalea guaymasensis]
MTSTKLKIIACITMLIDHLGYTFFMQYSSLRIIGRIAFPIFAFLIAEGYYHTHDVKKYFKRLIIFGLISQIPYALFSNFYLFMYDSKYFTDISMYVNDFNIFFTLALGLLAIYMYDKHKKIGIIALIVLSVLIEVFKIPIEYSYFGIFIILGFYVFRDSFWKQSLSLVIITSLYHVRLILVRILIRNGTIQDFTPYMFTQFWCVLALIFIYLYNGKKGRDIKYIFYAFYPVHLLIIFATIYILYA